MTWSPTPASAEPVGLGNADETVPRQQITGNNVPAPSGSLRLTYFVSRYDQTTQRVRLANGAIAGADLTLVRVGLYTISETSENATLVASTPNDTTLLTATNTEYLKAFSAPYVRRSGQRLALGLLVVGTTTPQLVGHAVSAGTAHIFGRYPRISGKIDGLADLPMSFAGADPTNTSSRFYAELLV